MATLEITVFLFPGFVVAACCRNCLLNIFSELILQNLLYVATEGSILLALWSPADLIEIYLTSGTTTEKTSPSL